MIIQHRLGIVRIGTEPGASDILYANGITDPNSENYGSTLIDIPSLLLETT